MNFPMAQSQSQNKLCTDVSLTTKVMAIFVIFLPILAKIWLPWQLPLDLCNQKCLIWIGRPQESPVISNCILVVSRRNAFICIHSNFVPKLVAMVTPICPCVRECHRWISRWHKRYRKTKLCMDVSLTTEVMVNVWYIWPILAIIWLPWQRPLDLCNEKCSLDWSTTKTPCYK